MDDNDIKRKVRERYSGIAESGETLLPVSSCCCGTNPVSISSSIGYNQEEMSNVPEGSNLGLGCGNPVAIAGLKKGEVVVDLGSGAGFDCFLSANEVGPEGKVIGVDMTPAMLERARKNAEKGNYSNVEFRLGEIENLPVADSSADVIISNCVINLSTDKKRVFDEAYRILKPGGRLHVSDIVLERPLPEKLLKSVEAYVGCIAGAMLTEDYLNLVKESGFTNLEIADKKRFDIYTQVFDPEANIISKMESKNMEDSVVSMNLIARKK